MLLSCSRVSPGVRGPALLLALALAPTAVAAGEADLPGVAELSAGLERRDGLLPTYVDRERGRLLLELPAPGRADGVVGRFLYVEGLATGLGSNPVGLDRGRLGPTRLVVLRRVGDRLLVEQLNPSFRASSDSAAERRAVDQSFATSVLWGTELVARDDDGGALVDLSSFLVRDAHGVRRALATAGEGDYELDASRSAVDLAACLAFPDNLEFEAVLTFAAERPGSEMSEVAPSPTSVTLVQHHSLIRLPDAGYRPRRFDPRAGSFAIRFVDYAAPLGDALEERWIVRHRLEKLDPRRERSRVREPIVYYVDSGTPEPVRSALLEGAGWWDRAFEAAGFLDAFRVELLPEGAHPLDVRYNVIQWVHRATRGWSYGGGIVDPRTGEMIKGHVTLGSLRVRQDRLLFEGLLGTAATDTGAPDDPVQLALARIRQLAAHEVGHTLGLAHNFAASTYGNRASVMDYPAPLVRVGPEERLDVSAAYGVGVGIWDLQAIRYAYAQFPPGRDESAELARIVREGLERGWIFLSDGDARPAGAAQPLASLWDNGADAVDELEEVLHVRRVALRRFGRRNIAEGRPLALLEEVLAPVYFYHRYQLQAAAKTIGGLDYRHALRGDGQAPAVPFDPARQRRALQAVLRGLDPDELDLPEELLGLLLPRPNEYPANREMFRGGARPAFDALGAAAAAAGLVVAELLQPERCVRLVDWHRRDPQLPGLETVLDALDRQALDVPVAGDSPRRAALAEVVRRVVVDGLISLSGNPQAGAEVRARVDAKLAELEERFRADSDAGARFLADEIRRHRERGRVAEPAALEAPPAPPGSPIGRQLSEGRSRDELFPGCSTSSRSQ